MTYINLIGRLETYQTKSNLPYVISKHVSFLLWKYDCGEK